MSTDKIEPRLRQEIDRIERDGTPVRTLSVIVEPVAASTEPLRLRMTELDVAAMDQLILAAGIVADLTIAQIRALAEDATVKRITWNAVERVVI